MTYFYYILFSIFFILYRVRRLHIYFTLRVLKGYLVRPYDSLDMVIILTHGMWNLLSFFLMYHHAVVHNVHLHFLLYNQMTMSSCALILRLLADTTFTAPWQTPPVSTYQHTLHFTTSHRHHLKTMCIGLTWISSMLMLLLNSHFVHAFGEGSSSHSHIHSQTQM